MRYRRILVLVSVVLVLLLTVGAGVFIWNNNREFEVRFEFKAGEKELTIDVYADPIEVDHAPAYDKNQEPIASTKGAGSILLKRGTYIAVSRNNARYQQLLQIFTVDSEGATVTLEPRLTQAKLKEQVADQKSAVLSAVNAEITGLENYNVHEYKLYLDATWAGVVFAPKDYLTLDKNQRDFLRVVLRNENGAWTVKTDPEIVLGTPKYPDIPRSVLIDINKTQTDPAPQIRKWLFPTVRDQSYTTII